VSAVIAGAGVIYRSRRYADSELRREEVEKTTGVDPVMARHEERAAEALRQFQKRSPTDGKSGGGR
jgi:hypothetical protein